MSRLSLSSLPRTMKAFSIDKTLKSEQGKLQSRLGQLRFEDRGSEGGETLRRTPMYLIHTQTGSVPHISREVFRMIYPTNNAGDDGSFPPIQISVDSTLKFVESLGKFKQGIGKFVGLPEVPTFLCVHDPLFPLKSGHNDKFGVSMWSRHGRATLTPQAFTDALKVYNTDFCQVISDYDVNPKTSGMKRLGKSLTRAEEYTSKVLQDAKSIKTGVFITLEAAWFQMDNNNLVRKTVVNLLESQHKIEGVILSGLTDRFGSGKTETSKDKEVKSKPKSSDFVKKHGEEERLNICEEIDLELVSKMLSCLPPSLPKYVPGPLRFPQMVDLVARGVDLFDTSSASRMADNAEVFLLDRIEEILPKLTKSVEPLDNLTLESLPERSGDSSNHVDCSQKIEELSVVSLEDKRYFDDFGPISKACTCYTCRKHTRSYVHHLFATDELLGPVLIQIHNLTAFDRFFKVLRGIIEDSQTPEDLDDKLNLLRDILAVQKRGNELNEKDEPIANGLIA